VMDYGHNPSPACCSLAIARAPMIHKAIAYRK
jgi:hypothetical protein